MAFRKVCLQCDSEMAAKRAADPTLHDCVRCGGDLEAYGSFLSAEVFVSDAQDALWRALGSSKVAQRTLAVKVQHFPLESFESWMEEISKQGRKKGKDTSHCSQYANIPLILSPLPIALRGTLCTFGSRDGCLGERAQGHPV